MLGSIPNKTIEINKDTLTKPIFPQISLEPVNIFTDVDWNLNSRNQVSTIGAIYQSIDQAEQYYNSLYTLISSRLSDSERRLQEQDSNLKVLLSASRTVASTTIHLKGGDETSIERDEKYYRDFGPLQSVAEEGIFRLKDTGFFSSIRSLGGFAGNATIEFSLGELVHNGELQAITDGTRNTFWTGTYFCPAPIRADQNDVSWLPQEYNHGFACMITYYLDRPTLATEVYIEPVTTEPLDLVSISWSPINIISAINNGTFTTSGNWAYNGSTSFLASSLGLGVASGACIIASNTTGYVSQTFGVSGSYLASGAVSLTSFGNRCQINYSMMGRGNLSSGIRIKWLNVSGEVIEYKLQENYPAGFFTGYSLVDYIPVDAVSGRIEVGIFTPCSSASAYFDNVQVIIGEKQFQCQEIIDRPKTVSLPEIARSGRFSFVFAQRNPRKEVLAKEGVSFDIPNITENLYLDPTLQNATKTISKNLVSQGPGTSIFAYRLGMKELDLRYREHIPRGSIVSLPLFANKEIRQIWVTSEIGQQFNDNTKFYIYPFAENSQLKTEIQSFGIGEVDSASTTLLREGEILRVHTYEEEVAGWINLLDKVFITEPQIKNESFDGTDRDGKVKLTFPPHLRRVYLKEIQDWLRVHSIWSSPFDPNLETIYGLPANMQSTIDAIRNNTASGFQLDDLISREGYLPLRVTVTTDKWTAVPDTYGRPDVSKVRTVLLETLTETTMVETNVDIKEDILGFDAWLNSTTIENYMISIYGADWRVRGKGGTGNNLFAWVINQGKGSKTDQKDGDVWLKQAHLSLKQMYDDLVQKHPSSKKVYDTFFKNSYDQLKAQGKIGKSSNSTQTTTSAIEVGDVYSTKYKPIITGPSGTFINLYWYSTALAKYIPIPRSSYEVVNPSVGLIKVLEAAPSSYTTVLADYKYISYSETEDHFGSIVNFTIAASSASGANVILASKPLPVTRNMTDYEDGRIPELRSPNFDRLSKDYYPIIEYYINNDGEIIFSRDFFRYGDMPAKVTAEYLTLAIQPRVSAEITRSGSPAVTPTISNVSLRVRESSSLPTRGNN